MFVVLGSGDGLVQAVDQADTLFPEENVPPQYKHIAEITLPASYHSHWPANQEHIPK